MRTRGAKQDEPLPYCNSDVRACLDNFPDGWINDVLDAGDLLSTPTVVSINPAKLLTVGHSTKPAKLQNI